MCYPGTIRCKQRDREGLTVDYTEACRIMKETPSGPQCCYGCYNGDREGLRIRCSAKVDKDSVRIWCIIMRPCQATSAALDAAMGAEKASEYIIV